MFAWIGNIFKGIFSVFSKSTVVPQLLVQDACAHAFTGSKTLAPKALFVVDTAIAAIKGGTVGTLPVLNGFVQKQISGVSLTPEEQVLVGVLLTTASAQISSQPAIANLNQALTVLGWVQNVAAQYAAVK